MKPAIRAPSNAIRKKKTTMNAVSTIIRVIFEDSSMESICQRKHNGKMIRISRQLNFFNVNKNAEKAESIGFMGPNKLL